MVVAAGKRPRERHEPAHERLARTHIARAPRAEQLSVAIPPSTRILLRSGLYSRHPRPPWSFALLRRYYGQAPVSNGAPRQSESDRRSLGQTAESENPPRGARNAL